MENKDCPYRRLDCVELYYHSWIKVLYRAPCLQGGDDKTLKTLMIVGDFHKRSVSKAVEKLSAEYQEACAFYFFDKIAGTVRRKDSNEPVDVQSEELHVSGTYAADGALLTEAPK